MPASITPVPELAEAVKAARIQQGYVKRAAFGRQVGVDDSTMAIIERARAGRVSPEMLDRVTGLLGWDAKRWRAIQSGEEARPTPLAEVETEVLLDELRRRLNAG